MTNTTPTQTPAPAPAPTPTPTPQTGTIITTIPTPPSPPPPPVPITQTQQMQLRSRTPTNNTITDAVQPPPPAGPPYTNILHTHQTPPAPTGSIAQAIHTISIADQLVLAENLYNNIGSPTPTPININNDTQVTTALVALPNSCSVQVVFAVGFGASAINTPSPLDNKFLALHGEGDTALGFPEVLVLEEADTTTYRKCLACTDGLFKTTLTAAGPSFGNFLLNPRGSDCTENIMAIAPIPSYFVYDGLNKVLNAAEVYERLLNTSHTSPMLDHAKAFLRSVVIGPLRKDDEKPFAPVTQWQQMPPIEAKSWRKDQCENLLPTVFPKLTHPPIIPPPPFNLGPPGFPETIPPIVPPPIVTPPLPTPKTHAPAPGPPLGTPNIPPSHQQLQDFFFHQMYAMWQKSAQTTTGGLTEEKKDEPVLLSTKISELEQRNMQRMCGQSPHTDEAFLPLWFRSLFQKNQTKIDRDLIVAQALNKSLRFEDERIPSYPELKTMIQTRNWTGGEAGGTMSYAYACHGLTPFAMLDLTTDEQAQLQYEDEIFHLANSISPSDIKNTKKKLVPTVPEDGIKWRSMILKLTNLSRNLFTADCPYYQRMLKVSTIIRGYQLETLQALPHAAKAAILWICHLQARHFAQGKMFPGNPEGEQLPAFQWMISMLQAGQIHKISYAGIPAQLLAEKPTSKRKFGEITEDKNSFTDERLAKLLRLERKLEQQIMDKEKRGNNAREPWNETLKGKLLVPLKTAKFPSLNRVCKFCNITNQADIAPDIGKRHCRNYLVLGRCKYGDKCNLDHKTATDAQATSILTKLEEFIAKPEDLAEPRKPIHEGVELPPIPQIPSPVKPPGTSQPPVLPPSVYAQTTSDQQATISEEINKLEAVPDQVKEKLGKTMDISGPALQHPAAPLLQYWTENGCTVDCGIDWPTEWIEAIMTRGPHKTACDPVAIDCLIKETHDKVRDGYARLVRWGDIKHNRPKNLKVSPIAAIPHKSRMFRMILDLSFQLKYQGIRLPSVNSSTVLRAPYEAMSQLGHCVQRIVNTLAANYDPDQPFVFSKLDIKDGFWRLAVNNDEAWNFCYVMPTKDPLTNLEDAMIVVPNSLQMGWCESPPYFCAATETARDVIDQLLTEASLPVQNFEDQMLEKSDTFCRLQAAASFTNLIEVFVDDFCACTNNLTKDHLAHFSRAMLMGIHSVFPPPEVSGHSGEDPVSQKKLAEGEGTWEFTKEILGWILDGAAFTLQLPPKKCEKIITEIRNITRLKGVPLKRFQSITGKLQHAAFGTPGGKGLMSPLHMALNKTPTWVKMTPVLKQTLLDWKSIIRDLVRQPTHVTLLVPNDPNYIQYTDACGLGAGGVICSGSDHIDPIVWQFEWPDEIKQQLITDKNPTGTLTINDLELAGMILGWLILEITDTNIAYKHIGSFCDNISAVSWAHKGHTSRSVPAARLLRFLNLRQRTRKVSSLLPVHIAGVDNDMADICSRAFKDEQILEGVLPSKKADIASDLLFAWRSATHGVTRQTARMQTRYWRHWTSYTAVCGHDPYLEKADDLTKAIIVMGFAARVRTGACGKGEEVKVQSVRDALASVAKTLQLVNKPSFIHQDPSTYIVPVQRCLEGFRRLDPPAIPQLALPVIVPETLYTSARDSSFSTELDRTIGDLSLIAFYFLLRSGEYTKPKLHRVNGVLVRATRTETFKVGDIGFWKDGKVLSRHNSLDILQTAESATMKITHQKNGRMGEVVHQETTGEIGAVAALARRVHHVLKFGGSEDSPICNYYDKKWHQVTQAHMLRRIRFIVQHLGLHKQGIDPDIIGNHSLRSGGAMALKLAGFSDSEIQKFGRWKSATWMMYMHNQIAYLSKGVAKAMSTKVPFLNIGYIEAPQTQL